MSAIRQSRHDRLAAFADTLHTRQEEISTIWRFTRNNGITEGFHNKMETINRQAYGFRHFNNYRMRVMAANSPKPNAATQERFPQRSLT